MNTPVFSRLKLAIGVLLAVSVPALADRNEEKSHINRFRVAIPLISYQEVPSVSSPAVGSFRATIDRTAGTIQYELAYEALVGEVRQAHIHFGQRRVNGGVSVFLCQTTTNVDPTGLAPTCSAPPARITGTLTAANIIGPGGQGIAAMEIGELIDAIAIGAAYVNVHSSTFPGGEIRGQLP